MGKNDKTKDMHLFYHRKKLSNFSKHMNWKHAANYVCKQYIDAVSRDVYFDDVRLQMDAKLWGEEYNRYNPPKKVCYLTIGHLDESSPMM